MAKLILKSPYLKPLNSSHIAKYVNYIATREGVELAESTDKVSPCYFKANQSDRNTSKRLSRTERII